MPRFELSEENQLYFERELEKASIDFMGLAQAEDYTRHRLIPVYLEKLNLAEFLGFPRGAWAALVEYLDRSRFDRKMELEMGASQRAAGVGMDGQIQTPGLDLPTAFGPPTVTFILEGKRRRLTCTLGLIAETADVDRYPVPPQCSVPRALHGFAAVSGELVSQFRNPYGELSAAKFTKGFEEVALAFGTGGLAGVWHELDRVWSRQLTQFATKAPLQRRTLMIRCAVLLGRRVRVFTPDGERIGTLEKVNRRDGQSITGIILSDTDDWAHPKLHRALKAEDIREIAPWRD